MTYSSHGRIEIPQTIDAAIATSRYWNPMQPTQESRRPWLRSFFQADCGATVVEAALMLGLIILGTVVGMGALGQRTNHSFDETHTEMPNAQ